MPLRRPHFPDERDPHIVTRTLACLAAALLLTLGAFTFWPARGPDEVVELDTVREMVEPIELVEIPQTAQPPPSPTRPPPPPPLADVDIPPVEVDDLIEIEDLVVERFEIDTPAPSPAPPGPPAPPVPSSGPPAPPPGAGPRRAAPAASSGPILVESPDVLPRTRFAAFPEYPDAARRDGVQARATIRALISEGGRVMEAEIVDRVLIDKRGNESHVNQLPHGMDGIALATVRRYVHSPAKHQGRTVRTYTRITITIGAERGG